MERGETRPARPAVLVVSVTPSVCLVVRWWEMIVISSESSQLYLV